MDKNLVICDNMHGSWRYFAEWSKSDGERQMPSDFTHMCKEENQNKQKIKTNS